MLSLAKKTPTRIDDFLVLILGLVMVIVPTLKIFGWLPIPFEYLDVFFGMVVPVALGIYYWSQSVYTWLKNREAGEQFNPPDTKVSLMMGLGLYHVMPIWRVSMVGENTMISAVWLAIMIFATTAVISGRYLWFLEFFSLIWGGSEVVAIRATSLSKRTSPNDSEWQEEAFMEQQVLEVADNLDNTPPVAPVPPKPPGFGQTMQWVETRESFQQIPEDLAPNLSGESGFGFESFSLMSPRQLLDKAALGDDDALEEVIARMLSLNRERLISLLKDGRVPDVVINKVIAALDGEKQKLREVFGHQAFERQKPAFESVLNA